MNAMCLGVTMFGQNLLHMSDIGEVQLQYEPLDAASDTKEKFELFATKTALVRCNSNMCSYMQV